MTGATTVSAADRAVELVRNHLRQHQDEEVSLEDLGELTGYHPIFTKDLPSGHRQHAPRLLDPAAADPCQGAAEHHGSSHFANCDAMRL